jgi:hypothetical protein
MKKGEKAKLNLPPAAFSIVISKAPGKRVVQPTAGWTTPPVGTNRAP